MTLGECELIDEIMVGEDRLIRFSGCKSGSACTIILRGASSHLLDEVRCPPRYLLVFSLYLTRRFFSYVIISGRAFATRRALRPFGNGQGDSCDLRRRLHGNAHGQRDRLAGSYSMFFLSAIPYLWV